MTTTKYMPVAALAAMLAAGTATAQTTSGENPVGLNPVGQNPNRAIEQQIESRTGAGATDAAVTATEPNTLGEAAATGQTAATGSGAAIEWVGKPVAAIDGTRVGTVSEVVTDQSGAVTEIRAKVGGLFGLFTKEVAIPASRVILEQDGMLVAEMSADEIKSAPAVEG